MKFQIILINAWVFVSAHDVALAQAANTPFTITDRGGVSIQTPGTAPSLSVGYGSIQPDAGKTTPSAAAILGFRANNILVSETDVPATTPMLFPQIVDGGGYSTQFVLFSGLAGQATSGNVQFLESDGTPWQLTLK